MASLLLIPFVFLTIIAIMSWQSYFAFQRHGDGARPEPDQQGQSMPVDADASIRSTPHADSFRGYSITMPEHGGARGTIRTTILRDTGHRDRS